MFKRGYISSLSATRDAHLSPFSKVVGYAAPYDVSRYGEGLPADINPMSFAHKLQVPFLMLHGDADTNTSYLDAKNWKQKVEASSNFDFYFYQGGHTFSLEQSNSVLDKLLLFFSKD